MSELDVDRIRDSFERVKPIAMNAANKFYEFLFTDYPTSRSLFQGVDLEKQQKALINSLVFVVDNLENGEKLKSYLNKLGYRHLKYGTQEIHFEWVGASLLKTFEFFFSEEWTSDLEQEWAKAYGIITDFMKEGMQQETEDEALEKEPRDLDDDSINSHTKTNEDEVAEENLESISEEAEIPVLPEETQMEDESSTLNSTNVVQIATSGDVQLSEDLKNRVRLLVKNSVDQYVEKEIKLALNEKLKELTVDEVSIHLKKIVNG